MKKQISTILFLLICGLFLSAADAAAQTTKRVQFARGASSTTVKGRIAGYDYIDYILNVRAGQTLSANLKTTGSAEIVVFAPNGENVGGDARDFSEPVEQSGDYKIRVLMPRAFARRKAISNFTLNVAVR